jgi:hypothetical protein
MPTYRSRHNPRKQLIVLGERVASAETYDRYYDIGWESLQRGVLPLVRLEIGRLMFRYSKASIEQSRTLRPAKFSSNSREVRYSGIRLTGREGQGALYLASLGAVVRERVHYAGAGTGLILPGGPDHTRAAVKSLSAGAATAVAQCGPQPFHVYRLQAALLLADLRVSALVRVFQDLLGAPGARARFGISPAATAAGLLNAVLAPQDYSATRGLADAVHDAGAQRGVAGLMATSARGDADSGVILDNQGDGVEGLVYALFGKAEQRLDVLQPVASYDSFKRMREAVKLMPGFSWVA